MSKPNLQEILERMRNWLITLGCPNWSSVCFVENFDIKVDGNSLTEADFIPLLQLLQYQNRFENLISLGYDWIIWQAVGIYKNCLIISVEFPQRSIGETYPSINLSDPYSRVGLAAALEIPFTLIFGFLTTRFSKLKMIIFQSS
jgi:hypothetical protein